MQQKLYAFRRIKEGYTVIKCDDDFNFLGSYQLFHHPDGYVCSCPATVNCRHRKMLDKFNDKKRVDTEWWFNFDTEKWIQLKA